MNAHDRELAERGWRNVEPPRQPVLFVNPASGDGKAERADLATHARERGIEVKLFGRGRDLAELVREAVERGADALGVAGGDGSLAIVAAVARQHDLPFVCIPAGTRNHFALDVGVDRHDVIGALDAFTEGVERRIDLASVNGRVFVNNVSLGIYGEAVHEPGYRSAKVRTLVDTTREVVGPSGAAPELNLVDDEGRERRDPAVVLVSNNPYAIDRPVAQGTRPRLDGGVLGIIVLDSQPTRGTPGRAWTATSLEVAGPASVHAGIDGEAVHLTPPLAFEILPSALRVRIAARHPGASPSGLLP